MLLVMIGDLKIPALIDSGATHSIIGPNLLKKLPHLRDNLQTVEPHVSARAVNESVISYKQEINFKINIHDQEFEIHAFYSPILNYDLIIGYEFLKRVKLVINFETLEIQPPREYIIKAPKDITLKPNSEVLIWGQLTGKLYPAEGILQTHKTLSNMGCLVARGLITIDPTKPWIPICILNPYLHDKTIKKGTKLATIERLTKACKVMDLCNPVEDKNKVRFSPPPEFTELFDQSESTFSDSEKLELMCLLWEFSDIFLKKGDKLKCTDVLEFKINLKEDAKPFKARPYRSNPKLRKEITKQVQQLLQDGIIRPSTSPYGSPVLLVSKPDGTYRAVIDYRHLNSQTIMDNFPMISCQDSLESIGSAHARYFSTIDLQSGYYQVPIEESSKPYTAFVTHDGLYEFNRMSFGLANAPACFTRLMTRVLHGLNWDIALLYLDDIIIFSKDFKGHLDNLQAIFV